MMEIILNLFITLGRTDISTIISPSNPWVGYLFPFIGFFFFFCRVGHNWTSIYLTEIKLFFKEKKKGSLIET